MSQFLFGPADDAPFVDRFVSRSLERGRWSTFSAKTPSWEAAIAPLGRALPKALMLWPGYASVPAWVWSAPVPVVALAHDPNLLWHGYRHLLPLVDLILTDAPSARRLRRAGIDHSRAGNLFGLDRYFLDEIDEAPIDRDIDIVLVGNLNPAVQPARLPWINRLARLADRYRVVIATGVFGAEYRMLLRRAKLAFNSAIRSECNLRAFEAAAKGAVLLQESGNEEVGSYLTPDIEFLTYTSENFESVAMRALADRRGRTVMAERAKERIRHYAFENLIESALDFEGPTWEDVLKRSARRLANLPKLSLAGRTWQLCSLNGPDADPELPSDLRTARAHYSLALIAESPAEAEAHLRAASTCARPAAIGLGSALRDLGKIPEALRVLEAALADLEANPWLSPIECDTPPYPPRFDYHRVAWERAGYDHPDEPELENRAKLALLKCRAHTILAGKTGEMAHYEAAAAACPGMPRIRAALGCALARANRFQEAKDHLQFATENDPFDHPAAAASYSVLQALGDTFSARALRSHRCALAEAAPKLAYALPEDAPKPPPEPAATTGAASHRSRLESLSREDFGRRFGSIDSSLPHADCAAPEDTCALVGLLRVLRPRRVLEVGRIRSGTTATLAVGTPEDAIVFSIGRIPADGPTSSSEIREPQSSKEFSVGCDAELGGAKVARIEADADRFEFGKLEPFDFALILGGADGRFVRSESLSAYNALRQGGCLVWCDVPNASGRIVFDREILEVGFPEPAYSIEGTQLAFLFKGEGVGASANANSSRVRVTWEGEFRAVHSLAGINRSICQKLIARGHEVALSESSDGVKDAPRCQLPPDLASRLGQTLPRSTTVRHGWPPNFIAPKDAGAFVLIQPWEYGRLPRSWIEPIIETVDEVWVYTRSVLRTYVSSGVPEDKVAIVPPGVDAEFFRPGLEPLPLPTRKRIKLLFVGGTIPRKGFDVLLAAYRKAFSIRDDVCLVVKDVGVGTFYDGQQAHAAIQELRGDSQAPEILYLKDDLSEIELARLYSSCDALVQPYRGEGFALPVLEAMACGKPSLVTAGGPTDEFVPPAACWRIPARLSYFSEERIGDLPTVGKPWWLEPDAEALAAILKSVLADAKDRLERGRASREAALGWNWVRTAAAIEDRLRVLSTQKPVRFRRPSAVRSRSRSKVRPDEPSLDDFATMTLVSEPSVIVPATVKGRPRVSLTMIVKNEEHNLADCLTSVRDLVDEAVVVDTGSTDRTRAIAASFGAKLGEFPWIDHFAAARNAALDLATGDYAFWMDADDRLDEVNRAKLRTLFDSLTGENNAFVAKCLCVGDTSSTSGTVVDHVRIFRRIPAHRWTYRIHEQILPALRFTRAEVKWSGVTVRHVGYVDASVRKRKLERDIRLLKLDVEERPDDPFTLFNLGGVYNEVGDYQAAIASLEKSLAGSNPKDSIVRKLYALLTQCYARTGNRTKSSQTCAAGREHYPDDAELLFLSAGLARESGNLHEAEELYRRLVDGREDDHFASVDSSLRALKGRNNLAVMLMEQNRLIESESLWRACLLEDPEFLLAHTGLGELYLRAGNAVGLASQLAILRNLGSEGFVEATILDTRALATRGDFARASVVLDEAIAKHPQSLGLHVAMSHIRLAQGAPPDVLEASFRAILDLDPKNAQAKHNLDVLYRNTGKWIASNGNMSMDK